MEHVGPGATDQIGLRAVLEALGVGAPLRAAALGSVSARMARPGSERTARRWLGGRSVLGEAIGRGPRTDGIDAAVHASDALMERREAIEKFPAPPTVTGYNLTSLPSLEESILGVFQLPAKTIRVLERSPGMLIP